MFNLAEYRKMTTRLPDYLPWAALIAPGVILQKNALLQKTLEFRGYDLESSSPDELVASVAQFNNALRRLGTGWTIHAEAQRIKRNEYPHYNTHNPACWLIEEEREEHYASKGHFESRYYITFTWAMPDEKIKRLDKFFYHQVEQKKSESIEEELDYFIRHVKEIADIMRSCFSSVRELDDDETLTYLHSTISTNHHPVKTPDCPMFLDAFLPTEALAVGETCILGDNYIPTCSFTGFSSVTYPGMLDKLNELEIEYRWVVRFICMDKIDAEKVINGYTKKWIRAEKTFLTIFKEGMTNSESRNINTHAVNQQLDTKRMIEELKEEVQAFGYMDATVTVWHTERDIADKRMENVMRVIQSQGLTVKRERMNNVHAWLGSLPGHVYANVRRPILGTLNIAHMMPLSAIWTGEKSNAHLAEKCGDGSTHLICSTTGQALFHLNLAVGDVGHTMIIGPTGAGKSTLTNMLAIQWLRYPQAQVIIFDKDKSARCATLAVGGEYYEPASDEAPLAFQPLAFIDESFERAWAGEFIATLLEQQKVNVDVRLRGEIEDALERLAHSEQNLRTLSQFCTHCSIHEITDALEPYIKGGAYSGLFDANYDGLRDGMWQMIEMGILMGLPEAAKIPAMHYLFHRMERRFDGKPTLMILDEAWLFLSHPVFAERIQAWLKTLRKKNVYVVFATQEIADAMRSSIMPTLISACQTKIYLPNKEAGIPKIREMYESLGLSDTEIQILSSARPKHDYFYRSPNGRRKFSLDMGKIALTFCSTNSPDDHRFFDAMEREYEPRQFIAEMLKHKGIELIANNRKVEELV
jgi:type IV secretion system protein VirB4